MTTSITTQIINLPSFVSFTLSGVDSIKFLQGQLTCDVEKLGKKLGDKLAGKLSHTYQATAISNLKGRVQFGIWIKPVDVQQTDPAYEMVISADCADNFASHIKKFGAFSKITLSEATPIYPCVLDEVATFSDDMSQQNTQAWCEQSIATGNYWITSTTTDMFQPQELRLHQRGGVDYDKGCYLGQEVIARIYFKSAPKSFLHRVLVNNIPNTDTDIQAFQAGKKIDKLHIVNALVVDVPSSSEDTVSVEALVIARADIFVDSPDYQRLDMPSELMADVARQPQT